MKHCSIVSNVRPISSSEFKSRGAGHSHVRAFDPNREERKEKATRWGRRFAETKKVQQATIFEDTLLDFHNPKSISHEDLNDILGL